MSPRDHDNHKGGRKEPAMLVNLPGKRGAFALAIGKPGGDHAGRNIVLWIDCAHDSLTERVRRLDVDEIRKSLNAFESDDPDIPVYRAMLNAMDEAKEARWPSEDLATLRLHKRIARLLQPEADGPVCSLRYSAGRSEKADDVFVALGDMAVDGNHKIEIVGRDELAQLAERFPDSGLDDDFIAAVRMEMDRVAAFGSKAPDIDGASRHLKSALDRQAEKARRDERLKIVGGNPDAAPTPPRGGPELVV